MRRVGASRVQLSTLTPEELWEKSGRLDKVGSELFRLSDRKGTNYLLSPTHEEAITSLVASHVKFETQLPLRLYQISERENAPLFLPKDTSECCSLTLFGSTKI